MKTALIAGSTGLVGAEVLKILLQDSSFSKVILLLRKPSGISHPKVEEIIVNWDEIEKYSGQFQASYWFCCLGTTIKIAKSKEAFQKVDYEYVFRLACLAKENQAEKFLVISAMGADLNSKVFYNKVKGQMESALWDLALQNLMIFRPSLLLGNRKEMRLGEKLAILLSPVINLFLKGPLKDYQAIQSKSVAQAMALAANSEDYVGPTVFLSNQIKLMGSPQ